MTAIFISDLHLGCGDARDDFLHLGTSGSVQDLLNPVIRENAIRIMHDLFNCFIDHISHTKDGDSSPELVLLGDILDLLQVEPVEEEFRKPSRLHHIAEVHESFFSALRRFSDSGGRVNYVIGNHDHELMDPAFFGTLREYIPSLNERHAENPLPHFVDEESGIYAEHGNQFDPLNRFKDFKDPDELPLGSVIVLKIINHFEPTQPLFDNIQGTHQTLWYASRHFHPMLPEISRSGWMSILKAMRQAETVWAKPALIGPRAAGDEPSRSTIISPPTTSTRTATGTGPFPKPSSSR